jgi:hypothetical protein
MKNRIVKHIDFHIQALKRRIEAYDDYENRELALELTAKRRAQIEILETIKSDIINGALIK